jgi:hypothetical protein
MYSSFAQLSEETKQKLISRHGENIMEEWDAHPNFRSEFLEC